MRERSASNTFGSFLTLFGNPAFRFSFAILAAGIAWTGAASAQVTVNSVQFPAVIGRTLAVDVALAWQRTSSAPATIATPLPVNVTAGALPANCTGTTTISCAVPAGSPGDSGTISFQVVGAVVGGFNLTATATGGSNASQSGSVALSGDLTIGKTKTSPAANPVAGSVVTFQIVPNIAAGGDDIDASGSIVITDNLPTNATDFTLTNIGAPAGASCNSVASANASRAITCSVAGPLSAAAFNALAISIAGTVGTQGDFSNGAAIASGGNAYIDRNINNNTANAPYTVTPAVDAQALGSFPSSPIQVGSAQSLNITYLNNGPGASPAGGTVSTAVPAGFVIGALLPANCLNVGPGTVNGVAGTVIVCTTTSPVGQGSSVSFAIPLTAPAGAASGNIPVEVVPPLGYGDAVPGNNDILLPYQVVPPYTDLGLAKAKSPTPVALGAPITSTITVTNNGIVPAVYGAAGSATALVVTDDLVDAEQYVSASAGWTCTDHPATPAPGQHRVVCEVVAGGTLAVGAGVTLVLTTQSAASLPAPSTLTNSACTGTIALGLENALGRSPTNTGPQPSDANAANDCQQASVIATPIVSGQAQATVTKESSRDGVNWVDAVGKVPNNTIAGADTTGYWRLTVATPDTTANTNQTTIPTLNLNDSLPGLLNIASPGVPAPSYVTPPVPIVVNVTAGSIANAATACPGSVDAASGNLSCSFANVAPGTTIVVTAQMSRPFASGTLTNTATVSSPNAIVSATPGGQLGDAAALYVAPRVDVAMTQKSLNPPNSATQPRIGQIIQFTLAAENFGPDPVAGAMTITDTLDTAKYTLLSASGTSVDCTGSSFAAGLVSCASTGTVNRYDVRTVLVTAQINQALLNNTPVTPNDVYFANELNSAVVSIDPAQNCEWKTETATSAATSSACNAGSNGTATGTAATGSTPAAYPADGTGALANNRLTILYNIKIPLIDLQQRKEFALPLPNGQTSYSLDQPLIFRFRLQNNGPSRANGVTMTDVLTVPAGFTLSLPSSPYHPVNVNNVAAQSGYVLDAAKTSATVSCTQASPGANVVCVLNTVAAADFLDANAEVNFEIPFVIGNPVIPATIAVQFSDAAYVCGDETQAYESSGQCSPDPALAGNNLAKVNSVVFPKTDLQVVSKTATPAVGANVNQPIRYDIVVRNNGSAPAAKMIVTDPLPIGFEWMTGVDPLGVNRSPAAIASGATNGLSVNAVAAVAGVPAAGSDNVCFVASGPASIAAAGQQQTIQCNLAGNFPATMGTDGSTVTLTLWARPKAPFFNGPFGSNLANVATIRPGVDSNGDPVSLDANANNNTGGANTQVVAASIAGRTFLDRNGNGLQDGQLAAQDSGIAPAGTGSAGTWSVTLTGTDLYGNALNIALSSAQIDATNAGAGSTRGSYLFANLPPSNATGYTITQQQPAGYGNGTPASGSQSGAASAGTFSNTATTSAYAGVVLNAAQNGVNFNFPELQSLLVSGYAYLDGNDNGLYTPAANGDQPLPGVALTITGCGFGLNGVDDSPNFATTGLCAGDDVPVASIPGMGPTTVTTDATGFYQFALPQSGKYTVTEQALQPSVTVPILGTLQTIRGITTAGTITGSGTPGSVPGGSGTAGTVTDEITGAILPPANRASTIRGIVLQSGSASPNNNFGEVLPGSIDGVVYTEKGTPASNYAPGQDWPFPNVVITLTGTDDLGRPVSQTAATDGSGAYRFTGLRPGTYVVTKQNPPGIVSESAPGGGSFPGQDQAGTTKGVSSTTEMVTGIVLAGGGTQVTKVNFAVTNGPSPLVAIPTLPSFGLTLLALGLIVIGWSYRNRIA